MAIIIRKKAAPAKAPDALVADAPKAVDAKALIAAATPKKVVREGLQVLDGMCQTVMKDNPNAVIWWWLMASYLYYVHDMALLSDGLYDAMAQNMLARWDKLEHKHKHLISDADLRAGTLYALAPIKYPLLTRYAARELVKETWGVLIDVTAGCN
jgi:hypothetical protein